MDKNPINPHAILATAEQLADALLRLRNYYADGIDEDDEQEMGLHELATNALAAYNASREQRLDQASEHTPEPWTLSVALAERVMGQDGIVAQCERGPYAAGDACANARRIVACVNACAGTSTEKLESGRYGIVQTTFGD